MIDTPYANSNLQIGDSELLNQFILQRLTGLGTQSFDARVGVIARERSQIHAGDGAKQPSQLPIFLHGSPSDKSGGATFDSAGVYADRFDPFEIERGSAIYLQWTAGENGHGARDRG